MLLICLDVPRSQHQAGFPDGGSRSAVARRPEDLDQLRPADASAISSHAGSAAAPARRVRYGSASTAASPSRTSIGARCSRAPGSTSGRFGVTCPYEASLAAARGARRCGTRPRRRLHHAGLGARYAADECARQGSEKRSSRGQEFTTQHPLTHIMNVACERNEWPPDEPRRVLGEYAGQRITLARAAERPGDRAGPSGDHATIGA